MMGKRDNSNLSVKVRLREYYLEKYFPDSREVYVLDCCAGDSLIWSTLRKKHPIKVMSVDVKSKPGRIRIPAERIMRSAAAVDIVDIDTWGSPWSKYFALLETLQSHQLVVFLTLGITVFGQMQKVFAERICPRFENISLPTGFHRTLQELLWRDAIAQCYKFGYEVKDCRFIEIKNMKYIGFVLTQAGAAAILRAGEKRT